MQPLSKSLKTAAKKLDTLTLEKKTKFLGAVFNDCKMSIPEIAKLCNTYPNKIRRMLHKCGYTTRSRSEAQTLAIAQGRHPHPTKGTKRSTDTKIAISEAVSKVWNNLTVEEQQRRSQLGKDQWNAMSKLEQQLLRDKANDGIRKAAKHGSKLERYILTELLALGYIVDFHREQMVKNEKLQVDLFLPKLHVVIEIDGPSHFMPIWGEEMLQKSQAADLQKDGLLLDMGYCVLRVQQRKGLSDKYKRDILQIITETLTKIKKRFPNRAKRHIILGEKT